MVYIRLLMLLAVFGLAGFAVNGSAETQQVTVLNKHLQKLLGTWSSPEGNVTFNANNTIIYRGQKNFCAIAQGTIQISRKTSTSILPYRFLEGKLLITDGGSVTTYTRVP